MLERKVSDPTFPAEGAEVSERIGVFFALQAFNRKPCVRCRMCRLLCRETIAKIALQGPPRCQLQVSLVPSNLQGRGE